MDVENISAAEEARIKNLRDAIADNDRQIVKCLNARLALVRKLWDVKLEVGLDLGDTSREEWLHAYLRRTNRGSLSDAGVARLVDFLLDTTRDELGASGGPVGDWSAEDVDDFQKYGRCRCGRPRRLRRVVREPSGVAVEMYLACDAGHRHA